MIDETLTWHDPSEEPDCGDYELIYYRLVNGESVILWAKSEIDMNRVKCWTYARNLKRVPFHPYGCYLKLVSKTGCAFPELTCNICKYCMYLTTPAIPSSATYRKKREHLYRIRNPF